MRVLFLLIVTTLLPFNPFAKNEMVNRYEPEKEKITTLIKCEIEYAYYNKTDATKTLKRNDAFLVIYNVADDGIFYLANVWPQSKSQSFGVITTTSPNAFATILKKRGSANETFKWQYQNTYDEETGVANVTITKKGRNIIFKIETEDNDLFKLEGTIK